jgi:ABC-2 type transport system permease protein
MRFFRLIARFIQASFQEEAAYRANFFISLFSSALNAVTGVLGVIVLFGQVERVQTWDLPATLALLGVYLTMGALAGLVIRPGLETLAGMDGDIWSGRFDFTILRPIDTQFLVSLRKWRLYAVFDLMPGLGVLGVAIAQLHLTLTPWRLIAFLLVLAAGVMILYAFLLIFAALVFWSPGFLFTWLFDSFFQMARYPLDLYPGWLRLALTWIIPVGVITTIPAEALKGSLTPPALAGSLGAALALTLGASWLFRRGLRRYASASS